MIENKKSRFAYMSIVNIVLACFSILCVLPIVVILSISLSDEKSLVNYGYGIIPKIFVTTAYRYIFRSSEQILSSYGVSAIVMISGTVLSLIMVSMIAYSLSRPDFKYRNQISFYLYFTMLFGGGLVPWYMLISQGLHMKNTIWVLIIPLLVSPWNIFLLRTYFHKIPSSIIESASLDGAGEMYIYVWLIIPLSKPALATVGLFTALMYWNDSYMALLFIYNEQLMPLQFLLYKIMSKIEFLSSNLRNVRISLDVGVLPTESARMAMCILAAGPMLFVFPFFQKYFVKGLTVGSVKG